MLIRRFKGTFSGCKGVLNLLGKYSDADCIWSSSQVGVAAALIQAAHAVGYG